MLLLWLWCRPAAAAPIRPLTQEPPCAAGVALTSKINKQIKDCHCILITSLRITVLEAIPFKMLDSVRTKKITKSKRGGHLTCLAHKHRERNNRCIIFTKKTDSGQEDRSQMTTETL